MPAIALETSRLKQIETEIGENLSELSQLLAQTKETADQACVRAWETGRLLNEAKPLVGHGNFLEWLKNFNGYSERTLQRYMGIAEKYDTLTDLPDCLRDAYFALGFIPEKAEVQHAGNTALIPPNHYLSIVNRWQNWRNKVKIGKVKFVVTDQVKSELKPMYEWMKEIYGET